MSLAAYRNGYGDLRKHSKWSDSLFLTLQGRLRRDPTPVELAQPDALAELATVELLLRELHAEQAEQLPRMAWKGEGTQEYYLIEDPDLRRALGKL